MAKISGFVALVFVILGALFTWALYRMIYVASGDILSSFGIINDFYQNGLIVLITGTILYLAKKDIMKLLK